MIFENIGPIEPAQIIDVPRQQGQRLVLRGDFEWLDREKMTKRPVRKPKVEPEVTTADVSNVDASKPDVVEAVPTEVPEAISADTVKS